MINANPFAQPEKLWQIRWRVPLAFVLPLEEAVEERLQETLCSTASFEDRKEEAFWTVEVVVNKQPDIAALQQHLQPLANTCGVTLELPSVTQLHTEDWQPQLARDFPPLSLGRFFVHGAHARQQCPTGALPIEIEAGMAFGSGEHATTSGCLLALDALEKRGFHPQNVLDMGCGSGILSVGAARLWPNAEILAVDIDAVSVRIACENMQLNRTRQVACLCANGYRHRQVHRGAPYELIIANILARPLVKLSHDLTRHLQPGGIAVLSGLLAHQEVYVRTAHRQHGLALKQRIIRDGWATLILQKGDTPHDN